MLFWKRYIHNKFLFIKGTNMFNKVTKLLAIIALTGWMGVANATLIFDFSWDSSNGKISGEILGLTNVVGPQGATAVVITSINGDDVSLDVVNDDDWIRVENVFKVVGGEIVEANFSAKGTVEDLIFRFSLSLEDDGYYGKYVFYPIQDHSGLDSGSNPSSLMPSARFVNRVTVPEPNSVLLVSLGLAGLSFARYRKQS
jgi:hypothetical protein